MNEIQRRLAGLLAVKSIVTILMTVTFVCLSLCGSVSGRDFITVFSVVIAFYFGTQYQKRAEVVEKNGTEN